MISGVSSVTKGKRSRFPYRPDVHRRLIDAAASGRLITYSELGTGRGWVGTYLYRIAHEEDAAGRPPLTAIVVQKATREPGPGMQAALEQVGYARQGEGTSSLWQRAISDVFRFWSGKTAAEALASWRPQLGDSPNTWPRIRQQGAR